MNLTCRHCDYSGSLLMQTQPTMVGEIHALDMRVGSGSGPVSLEYLASLRALPGPWNIRPCARRRCRAKLTPGPSSTHLSGWYKFLPLPRAFSLPPSRNLTITQKRGRMNRYGAAQLRTNGVHWRYARGCRSTVSQSTQCPHREDI
jgi:hypothetical protein